jgi:septum formation protein
MHIEGMVADRHHSFPAGSRDNSAGGSAMLVLASGSATRARLLKAAGVDFVIDVPTVDEAALRATAPGGVQAAALIGAAKALAISKRRASAWVVGADQVLSLAGELLGKPGTRDYARAQLQRLRGRAHQLLTSVAVAQGGAVVWQHDEVAELTMRRFTDAALEAYLANSGDEVLGSPGAYHLEGLGASLFETVRGDYFSILGLPLLPLLGFLRSRGAIPE